MTSVISTVGHSLCFASRCFISSLINFAHFSERSYSLGQQESDIRFTNIPRNYDYSFHNIVRFWLFSILINISVQIFGWDLLSTLHCFISVPVAFQNASMYWCNIASFTSFEFSIIHTIPEFLWSFVRVFQSDYNSKIFGKLWDVLPFRGISIYRLDISPMRDVIIANYRLRFV